MIQGMNHYGYGITTRDDLAKNVVYTGSGVKSVVPYLRRGDLVRIQREGKSYGQMELKVLDSHLELADVKEMPLYDHDTVYELWGNWTHQRQRSPWLREDGNSAGKVKSLTITRLAMAEPIKKDYEEPRTMEDLEDLLDFYEERLEWRNQMADGFIYSVGFPRDPSTGAIRLFHEAMTEWGHLGVEYAQESLHMNGEYFDQFFVQKNDSYEEALEDLREDMRTFHDQEDESF